MDNNQTGQNIIKPKISSGISLVKKSLLIYKENFNKIIGFYLVLLGGFVPLLIVMGVFLFSDFFIPDHLIVQKIFVIILALLFFVSLLFFFYVNILVQISILLLLKDTKKLKVKEILKKSIKYFWPFLIINLAMGVFVFLWSLLFIIPGIIFVFYYIFAVYTFIFDGYRSTSALKRSKELVKNYWWAVVGRVLLLVMVFWVVLAVLSIPLWFISEASRLFGIYSNFIDLVAFVLSPIGIIYYYCIYKDLVEIKGQSKIINKDTKKNITIWLMAVFGGLIVGLFFLSLFVFKSGNLQIQIRDDIRLEQVDKIQVALDTYKNTVGVYPDDLIFGEILAHRGEIFMASVPENPLPSDGDCPEGFEYIYLQKDSGFSYELTFCLGGGNEQLSAGLYTLSPEKVE